MDNISLNIELYKGVYLIRSCENAIIEYYPEDEMKTPMHMSMGGESIPVGVCYALGETAQVLGSYRSHALYLAQTDDVTGFFDEMYGKSDGCAKGKAGSMHLSYPARGHMGSSAIVASHIPIALGFAFANKRKANNKIATVFFGDGAVDEGLFWESLNFASLKSLPVLFVYEDNGLAVHTHGKTRHGYKSFLRIISGFDCQTMENDGRDVLSVYKITKDAIKLLLYGPVLIRLTYHRRLEHVGVRTDYDAGYREEDPTWQDTEPVAIQRNRLLSIIPEQQISRLEDEVDKRVKQAIHKAKNGDFASESELFEDVFCE